MQNFLVDILTPSKVAAKGLRAESLLVPTANGQINILPQHTHIITQLGPGILTVFGGDKDADHHFVISKGICKTLEDKVVILTETCESKDEIDDKQVNERIEHIKQTLKDTKLSQDEIENYQHRLVLEQIRLQILDKSK